MSAHQICPRDLPGSSHLQHPISYSRGGGRFLKEIPPPPKLTIDFYVSRRKEFISPRNCPLGAWNSEPSILTFQLLNFGEKRNLEHLSCFLRGFCLSLKKQLNLITAEVGSVWPLPRRVPENAEPVGGRAAPWSTLPRLQRLGLSRCL